MPFDRTARRQALLASANWSDAEQFPLAGDASARRYLRLKQNGKTAILMDAPPDSVDSTGAFIALAQHLTDLKLSAPHIIAADSEAGFVLMEDLGDAVLARVIPGKDPIVLYRAAVDVLLHLREAPIPDGPEAKDAQALAEMIEPCFSWYAAHLAQTSPTIAESLTSEMGNALAEVLDERPVLALRDYHAENLIWLPERTGVARVGLLDFQDAIVTHPAYDLVSLLQDARRSVEPMVAQTMITEYVSRSGMNDQAFRRAYALLGLQRNLRILGVFVRLALRDGKTQYLSLIPRVWGYVVENLSHPDLTQLRTAFLDALPHPTPERLAGLCDAR